MTTVLTVYIDDGGLHQAHAGDFNEFEKDVLDGLGGGYPTVVYRAVIEGRILEDCDEAHGDPWTIGKL